MAWIVAMFIPWCLRWANWARRTLRVVLPRLDKKGMTEDSEANVPCLSCLWIYVQYTCLSLAYLLLQL
jgi:hypothetical protein